MDRLDLLGKGKRERLAAMSGGVLSPGLDAELQGIVTEAAAATQSPIGLVSLVLDHTQFFRAHVGLPPELAATRSTDRDVQEQ